jgi:hypothetical protein
MYIPIMERHRTTMKSVYQKLDERGAISDVQRDQVQVLRPQDTRRAIGVQDLNEGSCLVLMGTSPESAIMMAHISALDSEVHHMSVLRPMISIFIEQQELFQIPIAWGFFDQPHKDGFLPNHLALKTSRIFQHLRVKLHTSIYNPRSAAPGQLSPGGYTIVAVRHETELPELYIENLLVCPRIHSGSLALEYNRLGLEQIDHEHGDDGDDVNEKEG